MNDKNESVTLKETTFIVDKYSKGNRSKVIRDALWEYDQKRVNKTIVEKTNQRVNYFQNIMFIVLGISFLSYVISINLSFTFLTLVTNVCFILSGMILLGYASARIHQSNKIRRMGG